MSAFIVSTEVMIAIRNKFVSYKMAMHPADTIGCIEEINDMIRSWAKMNRYAVYCRYGAQAKPLKLTPWDQSISDMSDIQLYKHLVCLKYQCSEGNTEKKHRKAWNSLRSMIHDLAYVIISSTAEYNQADWG